MNDLVCKVGDRSIAFAYVDASQLYRHGMPLCLEIRGTGWRHAIVSFKTLDHSFWLCHTDFLSAKLDNTIADCIG